MRISILLMTMIIMSLLAVAAIAETYTIPQYTVVPVTINNTINSAITRLGDTITASCTSSSCGGFPVNTMFSGTVMSVSRASGRNPGQVEVAFTQVILPDGSKVAIDATPTALNANAVTTDPQTGIMTGTVEQRNNRNRFIGYGAGAGVIIGALTGDILKGGLIGTAAGWLAGATLSSTSRGQQVVVPAGTQFGLLLHDSVTYSTGGGAGPEPDGQVCPPPVVTPPSGGGPSEGMDLIFSSSVKPFVTQTGILMIPFRDFMGKISQPYTYDRAARAVEFVLNSHSYSHRLNSNVVYVDESPRYLKTNSRVIGGSLYIPSDAMSIVSGYTVSWNRNTNTLHLR